MVSLAASAQVYVGGTLNLWNHENQNNFEFTILPEVGYSFNDKWTAGLEVGYTSLTKAFTVSPYSRYTAVEWGKVGVIVDGSVQLRMADGNTGFGIGLRPGLKVDITDNLTFISHLGFLGYRDNYGYSADGFGLTCSGSDLAFGLYYNF